MAVQDIALLLPVAEEIRSVLGCTVKSGWILRTIVEDTFASSALRRDQRGTGAASRGAGF